MSNPMFREGIYQGDFVDIKQMTVKGSIAKTASLLLFALASGMCTWSMAAAGMTDKLSMFMWGGIFVAFIAAIFCAFKPDKSPILAPVYAIAEGLALGGISYAYNSFYEGVIVQAITATIITLCVMLTLYSTKLIQATDHFRRIVMTATLSIGIFYLIVILASAFHIQFLAPFMSAYNNVFVICFVIIIAALNLILDFDFIERGSQNLLPSYFEWYGALGLMVTLVWLYIEFLRLFSRRR